jgi:S-adenosylmethionine hydrolase
VFFLSDYGTVDEFVGVVHAVVHRLAPSVPVIDLSHRIPPFDVAAGADMLVRCAPSLGPGAVLAVVDPGVGTDRRAVAVRVGGDGGTGPDAGPGPAWLVGPDNGLLIPMAVALGGVREAWDIGRPVGRSQSGQTFDGRDLFAPAAARLAVGGSVAGMGTPIDPDSLVGSDGTAAPAPAGGPLVAAVSWVDHFGNVQLRLPTEALEAVPLPVGARAVVTVVAVSVPRAVAPEGTGPEPVAVPARRVLAFGDLAPGELGVMGDANGRVALVHDRAPAARTLGVGGPGAEVTITPGHGCGAGTGS